MVSTYVTYGRDHDMANRIMDTTGDATAKWHVRGTDLGYLTKTNHGYVLGTFGDTFSSPMPGQGWRSPVILRTHNTDLDCAGIKWDNAVGGGQAKEVLAYTHATESEAMNDKNKVRTIIPNDVIHLPDGTYLMHAHRVRSWNRHGRHSWLTWSSQFFMSTQRDAETWTEAKAPGGGPVTMPNTGDTWSRFQNGTMVLEGDWLYLFGTESGRTTDGGVYLARVKWQNWADLSKWSFWSWSGSTWSWGQTPPSSILAPMVPGGAIGEVNARWIEGTLVMAYCDYDAADRGVVVTRRAEHPAGAWTQAREHLGASEFPNLYAPAIHPYSTLDDLYLHVSQWTADRYGVTLFRSSAWNRA